MMYGIWIRKPSTKHPFSNKMEYDGLFWRVNTVTLKCLKKTDAQIDVHPAGTLKKQFDTYFLSNLHVWWNNRIFQVKMCNHPIETTVLKLMFPGNYVRCLFFRQLHPATGLPLSRARGQHLLHNQGAEKPWRKKHVTLVNSCKNSC